MLFQQKTFPFSKYHELYMLIVQKNNLLRRINEFVDIAFVYRDVGDERELQHV